jgi:hypothetical protein
MEFRGEGEPMQQQQEEEGAVGGLLRQVKIPGMVCKALISRRQAGNNGSSTSSTGSSHGQGGSSSCRREGIGMEGPGEEKVMGTQVQQQQVEEKGGTLQQCRSIVITGQMLRGVGEKKRAMIKI